MAEAPDRYCGNCGHELRPDDQFCRNCGKPVHRAARVPTPDEDVPVPPPPQAEGTTGSPRQQDENTKPTEWWQTSMGKALGILAAIVVVLSILASLAGGEETGTQADRPKKQQGAQQEQQQHSAAEKAAEKGPKQEEPESKPQPKPQPEYTVGQTAQVANVTWKVSDAFLTNQLKSTFGTHKQGRFVVVDFTFTNNRDEQVTLDPELHMTLKDSSGREFGTDPDAYEFMPPDLDIFIELVNPGVSTNGRAIYQVAPDAEGFTLKLDDVEFTEDESAVFDLGNIPLRAYEDPASASATASASPAAQ